MNRSKEGIMKIFSLIILGMLMVHPVRAQDMFWSFTDEQEPLPITPECDAYFDDVRGGVFTPSNEEVYKYGELFLESETPEVRRQAPYCFMVAAFAGNADAQLRLAQLYNKGDILPQDDLSAYKWAFISALSGNKQAEKFTLDLEQFLSAQDLAATGNAIEKERLRIQERMKQELSDLQIKAADDILAVQPQDAPAPTSLDNIFSDEDHFK